MTLSLARLLADTAALFRREADLILRLAGPLLFLPAFAAQLLCDPLPPWPAEPRDEAQIQAWLAAVTAWGQGNALWYLLADAIGMFGIAAIALLLLDPARPDVAGALGGAGRRFGRFVLAGLLVALPVGAAMWLLILPGLWMQARLIAAIPAVAGDGRVSAARSLGRSWAITRGEGWNLTAAVVTLFLLQWLAVSPLLPLEEWLRTPGHDNPFLIALVDAGLAAASTLYHVAMLLLGVVVYRRLASRGI